MLAAMLALTLGTAGAARAQEPALQQLLLRADGPVLTAAPAATPVVEQADYSTWRALKQQDAQASLRFIHFFDAYPDVSVSDREQIRHIVSGEVWAQLEAVEKKTIASRDELVSAIEAKRVAGALDEATAASLSQKVDRVCLSRLYYVYGNFWQRIMLEGFGSDTSEIPVKVQAILSADALRLRITDDELHAVEAANKFDPGAYGLPTAFFHKKAT